MCYLCYKASENTRHQLELTCFRTMYGVFYDSEIVARELRFNKTSVYKRVHICFEHLV